MSRVTKLQKQHRREKDARGRRWHRAYCKSRRYRDHHRCGWEGCRWIPRRMKRVLLRERRRMVASIIAQVLGVAP